MHPLMIPSSFALLLLLLFADAHSENLIEQVILPVDQPFHNNNNTVTSTPITVETDIIAAKYTYLMKLRFKISGDPAEIVTNATLDTGSDLIWLNAKGCCGNACHCSSIKIRRKTKTTTTNQQCIEVPKQPIPCDDQKCQVLKRLNIEKGCYPGQKGDCMYDITYPDGFITKGKLGKGEFQFYGQKFDFKDVMFGASTISYGTLDPNSQGIVGLGRGKLSLLEQLLDDKNHRLRHKFSYCLPNPKSQEPKSKIKFGAKVDTSKQCTSLLTKQDVGSQYSVCEDRYCVHLATISVGDRDEDKIPVSEKTNKVMVIDSGSTFTYLANGLFDVFLKKVRNVIGEEHTVKEFKPDYVNCFEESVSAEKLKTVSFEFGGVGGGSGTTKIELKQENFFDHYTPDKGKTNYLCLTVVEGDKKKNKHARLYEDFGRENENSNQPHLLGNRAQMDFLVAFDLNKNKVSFDKKDSCGKEDNLDLSVLSE